MYFFFHLLYFNAILQTRLCKIRVKLRLFGGVGSFGAFVGGLLVALRGFVWVGCGELFGVIGEGVRIGSGFS